MLVVLGTSIEYFKTGRGNKGLKIDGYMYKRHYETAVSVYWICTLSNRYKCKQRVIAEKGKPYGVRFKGPGHNHSLYDYHQGYQKSTPIVEFKPMNLMKMEAESDIEWFFR